MMHLIKKYIAVAFVQYVASRKKSYLTIFFIITHCQILGLEGPNLKLLRHKRTVPICTHKQPAQEIPSN